MLELFHENRNLDLIEEKRFDLYMKEMLPHFIGGVLTSAPFQYFIFRMQFTTDVTFIWFLLDAIFAVCIGSIYYLFYKHRLRFSFSTWKKLSYIPLLLYSFYLASAPWLLLQSDSNIYLYTMIVMLISLTGTTAYAVAYYLSKHLIFLTLPLLSLTVKITVTDVDDIEVIYAVLLFLWVSAFLFARHINKSLIGAIKLEYETIQARIDAERANTEKSQFIAAASHDIRQPLQAIGLFVNTLKYKNKDSDNDVLFERLEASVDGMSELLNNLLDVSKLDAQVITPQPQHLPLASIFKKMKDELYPIANQKGIQLTTDAKNCTVFADSILFERVLSNILTNAIRYTESGYISMSAMIKSDSVNISILDTGIGIPKEEQASIFLEFYQLNNPERDRNKGLGLGLAIVKRLCILQNWSLELESLPGEGSCFKITLPIGDKALVTNSGDSSLNMSLKGLSVVIIDDEEDIRFSLSRTLENWGCEVKAFESADDACILLKESSFWLPNLIISDYRLRNNKTGIDGIKQVREVLNDDVTAIVISGDTAPDRIKEIEASGLTMLHKPIKPSKLRSVIHHKMKNIITHN